MNINILIEIYGWIMFGIILTVGCTITIAWIDYKFRKHYKNSKRKKFR